MYVKEASLIFLKKREEKNAFRKEQRKRFSGHLERNKYQRVFFFFLKEKTGCVIVLIGLAARRLSSFYIGVRHFQMDWLLPKNQ